MSPNPRQKVLFIGGLGRSGSTLIERLLNELPQMFSVGESTHLWERGLVDQQLCGCGEPFLSCPHWAEVGERAFGGWSNVDVDAVIRNRWTIDRSRRLPSIAWSHRRGRPNERQADYIDHLSRVLVASAEVAGHPPVLLESSKHLSSAALLALAPQLDIRLVHLLRDPRGVAYSWTKQVARPETADGEAMPRYRPARTAARWMTDNAGFEVLARHVPSLRVRYEDFLAEPAYWLTQMAGLADIRAADVDLSFLQGRTVTLTRTMHSAAGNPMRFGGTTMELAEDTAWRDKLDRRNMRTVSAITAPLLAAYGYPIWPGSTTEAAGSGPGPHDPSVVAHEPLRR